MRLPGKLGTGIEVAREEWGALRPKLARRDWRFTLAGQEYPYLTHYYNHTWRNERGVELPVAMRLLDAHRGEPTLEVGNVSPWYRRHDHQVVDKYEVWPGVENLDVVDIPPGARYALILAISTLEHAGFDEPEQDFGKPRAAVRHLMSLLRPGGTLLVTIPLGQNPGADDLFYGAPAFGEAHAMRRVSEDGRWEETTFAGVAGIGYGTPYECANAVAFGFGRAG
ncbi:MAG: hypothetical protein ACR2KV_12770 [Solirubrobacteraceae bacterium]